MLSAAGQLAGHQQTSRAIGQEVGSRVISGHIVVQHVAKAPTLPPTRPSYWRNQGIVRSTQAIIATMGVTHTKPSHHPRRHRSGRSTTRRLNMSAPIAAE